MLPSTLDYVPSTRDFPLPSTKTQTPLKVPLSARDIKISLPNGSRGIFLIESDLNQAKNPRGRKKGE